MIFMGIKPTSTGLTLQDSESEYSSIIQKDSESSFVTEVGCQNVMNQELPEDERVFLSLDRRLRHEQGKQKHLGQTSNRSIPSMDLSYS